MRVLRISLSENILCSAIKVGGINCLSQITEEKKTITNDIIEECKDIADEVVLSCNKYFRDPIQK